MALVDRDKMDELRTASESHSTAETAQIDIQLKAVAYAINEAANTGEMRAVFQGIMFKEVKDELESKGYVIQNYNSVDVNSSSVISWKNA